MERSSLFGDLPALERRGQDAVQLLVVDRLGQARDEARRQVLAVGRLLLQRAEQDARRAGGAALAADFLHQILARLIGKVLLDHRGVEGQARAQFLHHLGAVATATRRACPSLAPGTRSCAHARMGRGDDAAFCP